MSAPSVPDIERVLFTEEQIESRIREVGAEISRRATLRISSLVQACNRASQGSTRKPLDTGSIGCLCGVLRNLAGHASMARSKSVAAER